MHLHGSSFSQLLQKVFLCLFSNTDFDPDDVFMWKLVWISCHATRGHSTFNHFLTGVIPIITDHLLWESCHRLSGLFFSLENLKEGDHAHLECRVEPINDPNLKIEWFVNGVAIKTGHRFRTTHDFGYVALDVLYTYADDSGTYMAKATNLLGEAVNTCQITVGGKIHI